MAVFASLVAGELHRMGSDITDRVPTVVSVLAKAARNNIPPNQEKQKKSENK